MIFSGNQTLLKLLLNTYCTYLQSEQIDVLSVIVQPGTSSFHEAGKVEIFEWLVTKIILLLTPTLHAKKKDSEFRPMPGHQRQRPLGFHQFWWLGWEWEWTEPLM